MNLVEKITMCEKMALRYLMQNPTSGLLKREWFTPPSQQIFDEVIKFTNPMSKQDLDLIGHGEYFKEEVTTNINAVRNELIKFSMLNESAELRCNLYDDLIKEVPDTRNPFNKEGTVQWIEQASMEELYDLIKKYNKIDDDYNMDFTAKYMSNTIGFCNPEDLPHAKDEISWLVDGMIMQNTFNEIIASQKAGKTQFTYQLAACVNNGLPFLGHNTIKKKVLYIDFEMENFEIYRRTQWLQEFLNVKNYRPFKVMGVASAKDISMEYILSMIRREKEKDDEINLVIFDNFYSLATDIDTNSMSEVMSKLKQIKNGVREDMTIILVNHTNKSVTRQKNNNPSFNEIMSSAFGSNSHGMFTSSVLYLEKKTDGVNLYTAGRYINECECINLIQNENTHWFFETSVEVAKELTDDDFKEIDKYLNSKSRNGLSKTGAKRWNNFVSKFGDKYSQSTLKAAGYNIYNENKNIYISVRPLKQ